MPGPIFFFAPSPALSVGQAEINSEEVEENVAVVLNMETSESPYLFLSLRRFMGLSRLNAFYGTSSPGAVSSWIDSFCCSGFSISQRD